MKLKHAMQGRIRVRATGTQLSRFLSILLARGILYEKAGYEGNHLFLELSAKQFREAVACAKKTGIRLRIVSKRGLPFLFFRHRRRKWAMLLVLPMLIGVGLLPRFVWEIEVEGLETISEVEMLSRLENVGISVGMSRSDLDPSAAKTQLLLQYEDLSFMSLSLDGTVLEVIVEEAVPAPEMVERNAPCDVVAAETCIIYSVVTESGTPLVKQGDVVQAGDVMILGETVLKDDAGNETVVQARASGEVFGKRTWRAEESIERAYEKQIWGEKARSGFRIRLGTYDWEIRLPFGKQGQEAVVEEEMWRLPLGGDLCLSRMTYESYELEPAQYSAEEMQQRLQERLEKRKAEALEEGERIALDETWSFVETDTGMTAILEMTLMENVGVTVAKGE